LLCSKIKILFKLELTVKRGKEFTTKTVTEYQRGDEHSVRAHDIYVYARCKCADVTSSFFCTELISERLRIHNREYHPVFQLGDLHIRGVPVRIALGSGKTGRSDATTFFNVGGATLMIADRVPVLLECLRRYHNTWIYKYAKRSI